MIERMKSAPTAGEGMSSLFQRVTGDAHMLSATLLGGLGFEQLAGSILILVLNSSNLKYLSIPCLVVRISPNN